MHTKGKRGARGKGEQRENRMKTGPKEDLPAENGEAKNEESPAVDEA